MIRGYFDKNENKFAINLSNFGLPVYNSHRLLKGSAVSLIAFIYFGDRNLPRFMLSGSHEFSNQSYQIHKFVHAR